MSKKKDTIKNIVIVAATDFPFGTASANLLRNLGLGLIKNGCNIHLLISRGVSFARGSEHEKRTNIYNGLKFTYCSFINKPRNYLWKIIDVFIAIITIPFVLLISKLKGNTDAVIIYTGYAYQNFPILLISKILRIPIFKYSVDYYNKNSIVRKWWMWPKWWMFILEISFLDRYLNGIISISQKIKDHYIESGITNDKLIIIPNIIDLKFFDSISEHVEAEKKNIFRIGYIGAAPILNGVDDLIKAFKIIHEKHDDTELLIVGDVAGGDSQLPILKNIAEDYGVNKNCIFTGRVDGNKVPAYLASCDILVMARKDTHFAQSGFPTKLGEYFAAKKPVVMTNVGDITQYFTDKKELMIANADSPSSVADKIIYLHEHKEESQHIAENGFQWAKENLEYINTSERILKFMMDNK